MKRSLAVILCALFGITNWSQDIHPEWIKTIGNSSDREIITSMAIDPTGSIISTGAFFETMDFDPNVGEFNITATGTRDIFVQKLTEDGNLDWVKTIGGTGPDYSKTITTDDLGNIYIGGNFSETVDFDPGDGAENRTSVAYGDAFLLKLDNDGNFLWVITFGGSIADDFTNIELGADGNLYTFGTFEGTIDFDPGPGETFLTGASPSDTFIASYTEDGDLIWAVAYGDPNYSFNGGLGLDSEGNIVVSGIFFGDMDVDPSAAEYILECEGYNANYVLKLSSAGEFIWAKAFGDLIYFNSNQDLVIDDEDNIYTIGDFYGTADFNPGAGTSNLTAIGDEEDLYILKLDSDGDFLLARSMGSNTDGEINFFDVVIDQENNLYFNGIYSTTVDFNPNLGTNDLTSMGEGDYFLLKLDENCNFEWAKSMGGPGIDYGFRLVTNETGKIYSSGLYTATVDLDPGDGTREFTSAGLVDIFIQKLVPAFVSLSPDTDATAFQIYPNPTNGNVTLNLTEKGASFIQLTDAAGKILLTKENVQFPLFTFEINAPQGIYFLTVEQGNTRGIYKIVKE